MLFKLQDMASLHKVESGGGTKSQQLREPLSGGGKKVRLNNFIYHQIEDLISTDFVLKF